MSLGLSSAYWWRARAYNALGNTDLFDRWSAARASPAMEQIPFQASLFTRVIPLFFSSDMRLRFFLSSLLRLYSEFLYRIFFPNGSQEARNT
jgi:hypothetical protein